MKSLNIPAKWSHMVSPNQPIMMKTFFFRAHTPQFQFQLLIRHKLSNLGHHWVSHLAHCIIYWDHLHTRGKYWSVIHCESKGSTPSLFYIVGIVSHSDLVMGKNSHQICVIPTNLSWTHIATIMGMFFKQKKLVLSAFKNSISFSTLKQKDNSTIQPMSSLGISTPSFFKSPHDTFSKCTPTIQLQWYSCYGYSIYISYITYPIVPTQTFVIKSPSLYLFSYISFYITLHY